MGFNSKMVRLKVHFADLNSNSVRGFNSKMVRLKVMANRNTIKINICFNSKMVRLKGMIKDHTMKVDNCFNSKMVRLKESSPCCRHIWATEFQFQNGSIKSELIGQLVMDKARFNSKMVRLKACTVSFRWPTATCFNSKMVRLKVVHLQYLP